MRSRNLKDTGMQVDDRWAPLEREDERNTDQKIQSKEEVAKARKPTSYLLLKTNGTRTGLQRYP